MNPTLPHTIENRSGEKIIFQSIEKDPKGDKAIVDGYCQTGAGPAMHTHFKQDEELTVVSGKMGYQVLGQEAKYAMPGEKVLFTRGTPHKFWADGHQPLHVKGWVQPAHSIVFYLSAVYAAQAKSGKQEPEAFDGAYLITRYASEYDVPEIPSFVKKVIFPLTVAIGKILGKYKHFKDAPEPLK
jgi:quercetin dioxygenase-like cupin family protein